MPSLSELKDYVHHYIFRDIFNYACNTLRNNTELITLNQGRPIRGSIYNNVIQTELPDNNNFYYLYLCSEMVLSNLLRDTTEWTSLTDIITNNRLRLDIYSDKHLVVSKAVVYGRAIDAHQVGFIIPEKVMQTYGIGHGTTMYLTISEDTDVANDRTIISHAPIVSDRYSDIVDALTDTNNAGKMTIYINGMDCDPNRAIPLIDSNNDYVDLIIDNNIVFEFAVSLGDRQIYTSTEESLHKDIIMIPRSLNADRVYTYDTFDLAVRDTDTGEGLALPYLADESVSQLSHNAISVSSYLIDAIFDILLGTHYELVVQVSDYSKDNALQPNGNLTEYLYRKDDIFVNMAFKDGLYPKIPVWTGDRLEASEYSKTMTRLVNLGDTLEEQVASQVESVGYHNLVNLVCRHNGVVPFTGTELDFITIDKPFYWSTTDLDILLYANGIKIPANRYSITADDGDNISVSFDTPYIVPLDATIQYVFMKAEEPFSYDMTPSPTNRLLLIPNNGIGYRAFRRVDSSYHEHLGLLGSAAYEEINPAGNVYFTRTEDGDNYSLYFSTTAYAEDFVIAMEEGSLINLMYNRNVNDGSALHFFLETETLSGLTVPVLSEGTYEIYLNGHYLIKELDYIIVPIIDNDNFLKGYDVVIQNKRWLLPDNDVEIYRTNQTWKSSDVGFVVDRRIQCNHNNEVWVEGLSRLFVNGKLVDPDDVIRHNGHFELANGVSTNGNAYHSVVSISNDVVRTYGPFELPLYTSDRQDIVNYFAHIYDYTPTQPIIVPNTHRIYSVYLTEVIKRIVAGTLIVNYIADDQSILAQLASVEYLKQYDLFFQTNHIDLDYTDMYPIALENVEVLELNEYLFINRLVTIVLGADHVNDGEVLFVRS